MRLKSSSALAAARKLGLVGAWGITGCQMALRADRGITLNGSNVSAWADQSGSGKNATQGTGANQPLFVANSTNNRPGVSFNGSSQFFSHSLTIGNSPQNYTIFVVAEAATNNANGATYNPFITLGNTGPGCFATIGSTHSGCYNNGDVDAGSTVDNNTAISGGIFSSTVPSQQVQVGRAFNDQDFYCGPAPKLHKTTGATGYGGLGGGNMIGTTVTSGSTRRLLGTIYELAVWNRQLTAAEIVKLQTYAAHYWGVLTQPPNRVFLHGNSLLAAIGGGQTTQVQPLVTLQPILGSTWWVQQQAQAGKQTTQLTTEYPTTATLYFDATRRRNVLLMWEIINDVVTAGASAATAFSHIQSYLTQAKADHPWDAILIPTMIPCGSGGAGTETTRLAVNALIMDATNQANNGYTGVPIGADTFFNLSDNTVYQPDGIHLFEKGYIHVAQFLAPYITAV